MSTPISPLPDQMALLSCVIREVARSRRMSREDAEDFAQTVHLRVVEREYDVFSRFDGRSSLRRYLNVVVLRMLLDWQNSTYGKWRPTVAATRLGEPAIRLERLVSRDGFTADEAIEIVSRGANAPSRADLRQLQQLLPPRQRRRRVSIDVVGEVGETPFADPLAARERRCRRLRARASLSAALERLPVGDLHLIQLRFRDRRTVQDLANTFGTDPKVLYRRFDRMLRSLRRNLEEQGVTGTSMFESH